MKNTVLLIALVYSFSYINLVWANDDYADEAIIDPAYMVMETWSQPDFAEPVEANAEDRGVASQVAPDEEELERHPWEYLEVQTTLPHTEPLSRRWYERKVLREMQREEQEADGY